MQKLRAPLTITRIWKILIEEDIKVYPDGLFRLEGIFSESITFHRLNIPREKIHNIRKPNGRLKSDFAEKLARFMARERPKKRFSDLSNTLLISYGIVKLLSENNS